MNPEFAAVVKKTFRAALPLLVLVEILSFCGQLLPGFSEAGFIILVVLALVLAFARPELAFLMLLAELFVGSQGGYMFSFGFESGLQVSLRLGLFLAVFTVWAAGCLAELLRRRSWKGFSGCGLGEMRRAGLLWPYLALLAVIGLASVMGLARGNDFGDVFFDANAYAYFALFPLFMLRFRDAAAWPRLAGLLAATITVSVAKALFVLYIFSHRMFTVAPPLYVWVRDTRVGEITIMAGDFYRVFFQSHVFALVGVFTLLLLWAVLKRGDAAAKASLALVWWAAAGLMLSLSRSFWFGGFCAAAALAALLIWLKFPRAAWKRLAFAAGTALVAALLVILAVYSVPFPRKGAEVSFASLIGGRAFAWGDEAAAVSRWALLPVLWDAGSRHFLLGSGLGTTVTYKTSDPRLLSTIPTGEYTTYAFEWGYHDLWVKFGLLGLAVYGWLLWAIARPFWLLLRRLRRPGAAGAAAWPSGEEEQKKTALAAGLLAAFVALLATNVFSPYLNHPLGIGILMILGAAGVAFRGSVPGTLREPGISP